MILPEIQVQFHSVQDMLFFCLTDGSEMFLLRHSCCFATILFRLLGDCNINGGAYGQLRAGVTVGHGRCTL